MERPRALEEPDCKRRVAFGRRFPGPTNRPFRLFPSARRCLLMKQSPLLIAPGKSDFRLATTAISGASNRRWRSNREQQARVRVARCAFIDKTAWLSHPTEDCGPRRKRAHTLLAKILQATSNSFVHHVEGLALSRRQGGTFDHLRHVPRWRRVQKFTARRRPLGARPYVRKEQINRAKRPQTLTQQIARRAGTSRNQGQDTPSSWACGQDGQRVVGGKTHVCVEERKDRLNKGCRFNLQRGNK